MGIPLFPPFTSPLGCLRPKGMFSFHFILCSHMFSIFFLLTLSFGNVAVIRPCLDKVYLDRIDEVRAFPGRTFHDLVTLSWLAAWGLGPLLTAKNLSHEETTHRSKCRPHHFACFFFFFLIGFPRSRDNHNEGKQGKNCDQ